MAAPATLPHRLHVLFFEVGFAFFLWGHLRATMFVAAEKLILIVGTMERHFKSPLSLPCGTDRLKSVGVAPGCGEERRAEESRAFLSPS